MLQKYRVMQGRKTFSNAANETHNKVCKSLIQIWMVSVSNNIDGSNASMKVSICTTLACLISCMKRQSARKSIKSQRHFV